MRPIARQALIVALLALAAGPPVPKADIPALIRQLGGDTFAGRTEASRRLTQIGGPALPELRRALTSPDAEIRRRARRLVDSIERAVYAEVRRFEAHGGSVNAVAFSPDGKRAASGDGSHVRLWEVATGRELLKDDTHRDRVMAVAFSPDGKYLATGSEDHKAILYDAATLRVLHTFRTHRADVRAVAFTPDGKRLVSGDRYGVAFVWSVPDGKPLGKLAMPPGPAVFSIVPIGDRHVILAPRSDGAVLRALDPKDGTEHRFAEHEGAHCAAVSRDGKQLVTAGTDRARNHRLVHWSLTTRKVTHRLSGLDAPANAVAISPDGRLAVSGGMDKELRLWDLTTGNAIRGLPGHTNTIWSVAVSPDGKYALSGAADGTMRLWSLGR